MTKLFTSLAGLILIAGPPSQTSVVIVDLSRISTYAGGVDGYNGDGGPAIGAALHWSSGLTVDAAGNLFIADTGNHVVRRVSATGVITTVAGGSDAKWADNRGDGGLAIEACLNYPKGVAIDSSGNLYIGDRWNHRVRKVSAATGIITTVVGTGVMGFSGDGGPGTAAQVSLPQGLAFDAAGNLFIADFGNHRIRMLARDGTVTTVAGGGTGVDGGPAAGAILTFPESVTVDTLGNLYIAAQTQVRKVTAATGIITTVAGSGAWGIGGDGGPATAAQVSGANGVAVDRAGNLYISDGSNARVRKVTAATGIITTVAGSVYGFAGDGGPGTQARLGTTYGVALDAAGNLFISDAENGRIRKLTFWRDDVPLAGDIDGDARADLVVWRPDTGTWHWLTSSSGYDRTFAGEKQWGSGLDGDVPLLADLDGDHRAELIVWHPATGTWRWLTSTSGYDPAQARAVPFGDQALGDIPLPGDVDGDGKADLVVWRANTGTWYWLFSSTGFTTVGAKSWGSKAMGDVPLQADVDGDGILDPTVWRRNTGWPWASTGVWFSLLSSMGYDSTRAIARQWGSSILGDTPIPADADGDGKADLIVWRPAELATWYWLTSSTDFSHSDARQWGTGGAAEGDIPLSGDFDGDGRTDLAIWRARNGTWYLLSSSIGYRPDGPTVIQWGSPRPI